MNFKYIFKHHKTIAIIFICYGFLFLMVNVKHGIVANPALQFGMFTNKFKTTDTQRVFVYYVNGKKIETANLSFTQRDILNTTLQKYLNQKENNKAVFNSAIQVFDKIGIDLQKRESNYENKITDSIFYKWYKAKLETITNSKINNLEVRQKNYTWKDNTLLQCDTTAKKIITIAY